MKHLCVYWNISWVYLMCRSAIEHVVVMMHLAA